MEHQKLWIRLQRITAHDVVALVSCAAGRLHDARVLISCLALAAIAYAARGRPVDALCDTHLCVAYAARLQRAVQPLASWAALVADTSDTSKTYLLSLTLLLLFLL
jgi:hypothetical protein